MSKIALPHATSRIHSLDLLRGYFIVVIVLDHLWKYPSLWSLITGQAMLWVTAAEGFVIISGFLIGYIRGFKGLKKPFRDTAWTLLKRGVMLYVWMLIISMAYIYIEWQKYVPNMPQTDTDATTYWQIFVEFATTGKPHMWIHFLYLYAIFLIIAIGAVALLRWRKSWLVIIGSLLIYVFGILWDVEWMKWQIIFFWPSVAGFYFDSIRAWWQSIKPSRRTALRTTLHLSTLTTIAISAYYAFMVSGSIDDWAYSRELFAGEIFAPWKVALAGIWFTSFALIFERFTRQLQQSTFGVVEYLGTHSLTAYIIHGFVICFINIAFVWQPDNSLVEYIYFTGLGLLAVLLTYGIVRLPLVQRVIPR